MLQTSATSQLLLENYKRTRALTEQLCAPLSPEDAVVQPSTDASPPKWHMAHTTWFFEYFILNQTANHKEFNPAFNHLFNSYYQSKGTRWIRGHRGRLSHPSLTMVLDYRKAIDQKICDLLSNDGLTQNQLALLNIGINHEQQHQELLITDLKYNLGHNPLFPAYTATPTPKGCSQPIEWLNVGEGLYNLGHNQPGFSFDNETPCHKVYLQAFAIANRPVSNAEYLQFVADGGYENPLLWLDDGWAWVQTNNITAPEYWLNEDENFFEYTLGGLESLDLQKPVCHLSYYEAEAFARYAGMRLPTEAEWETAANIFEKQIPANAHLLNPKVLHPLGKPGTWFAGDVWEWTGSAYLPYPGYQQASGALGEYNGKFMINQMVMRGGSCATPPGHLRFTYRNFFYPSKRWQFKGFRLSKNI